MQELGPAIFMGLFQFGSLPHALACRNIELFAERVLPQLRSPGSGLTFRQFRRRQRPRGGQK